MNLTNLNTFLATIPLHEILVYLAQYPPVEQVGWQQHHHPLGAGSLPHDCTSAPKQI